MNKLILLAIPIIALVILMGCAKEDTVTCNSPYIKVGTECCLDNNNNNICDNDEPATAAPVKQQTVQETQTATQTTTQTETAPQSPISEDEQNKLLDKIDWSSINGSTIVFIVEDFGSVKYVNYGSTKTWRVFVPIKTDFIDFINSYNYQLDTVKKEGKTAYVFTEISKKTRRSTNELDRLSRDIQNTYENLLEEYPNLLA